VLCSGRTVAAEAESAQRFLHEAAAMVRWVPLGSRRGFGAYEPVQNAFKIHLLRRFECRNQRHDRSAERIKRFRKRWDGARCSLRAFEGDAAIANLVIAAEARRSHRILASPKRPW
jgi:hypothetical protein